jgi:four helix bundle protein
VHFEDLRVWQRARRLANLVYDLSDSGPFARDFGLRDQIRRASVSVMSNIAEGAESRTSRLFVDFLGRAKGSAGEVRAQAYLAHDRAYIDQAAFDDLKEQASIISRQLYSFIQHLERSPDAPVTREAVIPYLADAH